MVGKRLRWMINLAPVLWVMLSRCNCTVRYIKAIHDLETKTIHLRSARSDRKL